MCQEFVSRRSGAMWYLFVERKLGDSNTSHCAPVEALPSAAGGQGKALSSVMFLEPGFTQAPHASVVLSDQGLGFMDLGLREWPRSAFRACCRMG